MEKILNKIGIKNLVEPVNKKSYYTYKRIYIGDVYEAILIQISKDEEIEGRSFINKEHQLITRIYDYWRPLGVHKSLQQIKKQNENSCVQIKNLIDYINIIL